MQDKFLDKVVPELTERQCIGWLQFYCDRRENENLTVQDQERDKVCVQAILKKLNSYHN